MNLTQRINGSPLDQEVVDALDHLQQGTLNNNPTEPIVKYSTNILDSPHTNYLGHSTTFARMWTAIEKVGGRFHPDYNDEILQNSKGAYYYHPNGDKTQSAVIPESEIGKYPNITSEVKTFMINDNSSPSYVAKTENRGVYEPRSFDSMGNDFLKPKPGITQVSKRTDGPLGALNYTTVDFMVHNHREFEEVIQPYFFQVGTTVVVDFGWSHMGSTFDNSVLYDPNDLAASTDTPTNSMKNIEEIIYGVGHKYTSDFKPGILRSQNWFGRVSIEVGHVLNFSAKLDENNSYQCTLEICSRNAALASKEITEENGLSYLFGNSMDLIIKNIYANVQGIDTNVGAALSKKEQKVAIEATLLTRQKQVTYSLTAPTQEDVEPGTVVVTQEEFDSLSAEEIVEIGEEALNQLEIRGGGTIPQTDKQFGIHDSDGVFYISYGMLEDIYLNVFLTPTIDDKENFNLIFNSRNSYLRFDDLFLKIQQCKLSGNEKRNVFKIPANWVGSYNSLVMGKNATQIEHEKNGLYSLEYYNEDGEYVLPETEDGAADIKPPLYGVPIIPIRDLFIEVEFITKVFKGTNNISDALQTIWNTISAQSCDVWNVLISSTHDDSNTSISFQDINLTKKNITDVYEFDVTSHNSIVVNNDISFQIPKDKISAAVAMRNMVRPEAVKSKDLRELMDFIQASPSVDGGAKQFWRTIPRSGEANLRSDKEVGVNNKNAVGVAEAAAKILRNATSEGDASDPYLDPGYASRTYVNHAAELTNKKIIEDGEKVKDDAVEKVEATESDDEQTKKQAGTRLESFKEDLRTKLFDNTDSGISIHRYLPMELTLTVYGNTYLQVLDFITVNNIPEYMKRHFAFQIMGIQNQCTSDGWTTTYTAVMRNLSHSSNTKSRLKEPEKDIQVETTLPPEETVQELQDDPVDLSLPKDEAGSMEEVIEEVEKIKPAKPLMTVLGLGLPYEFGYDVLETTLFLSEKQLKGQGNKKSNQIRATEISTLQDLAYGYALRDHFLDPKFTNNSSIQQLYIPDSPDPIQVQPLDSENTRIVIGQFIDDYAATAVGDFVERVNMIDHPPEFIRTYTALETLNLSQQDLSTVGLENIEIPTVPYQITLSMLDYEQVLYKVTQERGAPTIFNEFFLPKSSIAQGVSYEDFLRGLMNRYFEYYAMLSTKKTSEELNQGKEPETEVAEEKSPEEIEEAPIDNSAESLWVESFMYMDMIRVNMSHEKAEDVEIYHYFIFKALDKIKDGARDVFFDKILPYTEEIVNVKSYKDGDYQVSFARGTTFYLKERPWYKDLEAWNIDPSFHTSENGYNLILYDLIEIILHECHHCYQFSNKTRIFGAAWSEPTTDWETPTIEFEALTTEQIMKADIGNLSGSDKSHIEGRILTALATVRENKYQASLDPPGKLNHSDVDADGDVDADDVTIRNIQIAAGRNQQSMEGLSDAEISEIYKESVVKTSKKYLSSLFGDFFRKIRFHFDATIEVKSVKHRKFLAETKKGMSDAEYNKWYLKRSAQGGFRTGPGLD